MTPAQELVRMRDLVIASAPKKSGRLWVRFTGRADSLDAFRDVEWLETMHRDALGTLFVFNIPEQSAR